MNAYVVKGLYEGIPGESIDVEMNIFSTSKDEAREFFNNNMERSPRFKGDWWEDEDIKAHTKFVSIEEFNDTCFKGKKIAYTTPLIAGGYWIDGYGMWEEMKKEMTDRIGDKVGKVAKFFISDFDNMEYQFFMKNKYFRQASIDAIRSCVSQGIDPFGY